jgi:hypothetical protein
MVEFPLILPSPDTNGLNSKEALDVALPELPIEVKDCSPSVLHKTQSIRISRLQDLSLAGSLACRIENRTSLKRITSPIWVMCFLICPKGWDAI